MTPETAGASVVNGVAEYSLQPPLMASLVFGGSLDDRVKGTAVAGRRIEAIMVFAKVGEISSVPPVDVVPLSLMISTYKVFKCLFTTQDNVHFQAFSDGQASVKHRSSVLPSSRTESGLVLLGGTRESITTRRRTVWRLMIRHKSRTF
jgi:hypothetical protein